MSDEGKPVRMAFSVTSARVEHYDGVIDMMVATEIDRCRREDKFNPSPDQIAFYKKELVRYMTIGRDLLTAQQIRIRNTRILNEDHSLAARTKLYP